MFTWWGHTVVKIRRWVLAGAIALVAVGIGWGSGAMDELVATGFNAPGTESDEVTKRVSAELDNQNTDLVVLYSSETATVDDPSFQAAMTESTDALRQHAGVANVATYYDTELPALVSADRRATFAVVSLVGDDEPSKRHAFEEVEPLLAADGLTTQVGGSIAFNAAVDEITERDLIRSEAIAMPLVLVLMILLFGGLVAAGMPLAIGMFAVLGAMTATRLISTGTEVSTFALNTITVLGLGMAIDYSLLIVGRFREELAAGHNPRTATMRTVATAGRTVFVSGLIVVLALASLLVFPHLFLRSMSIGGMAAVGIAMIGALTVLPAMLVVIGHRINSLRIPLPWLRRRAAGGEEEQGWWARLAHSVMRRPVIYITTVLLLLGFVAFPFLRVNWGGADERVFPEDTEVRVVSERIDDEFPGATSAPIMVLVDHADQGQVEQLVGDISAVPDVTGVAVSAAAGETTLLSVTYAGEASSGESYDVVRTIRSMPAPSGVDLLVGGRPAVDIDVLATVGDGMPWMAGIMALVMLVVLFLAFGSVLLPIKAVIVNLISIGASFGVVVWIFQEGHLSGLLGFTPTGVLEPTIPIFLLGVLFALAADYEVFLLSRIREAWDATGDPVRSVAIGMQRSGRIISAAALLLVAVLAAFATGGVFFAKLIGVGMVTAIVIDATLIRALVVPATMRLLGRAAWWAPGPLARLHRRYGIREEPAPVAAPVPSEVTPVP